MAKRIFVGNLPYETTDSQLSELFAQAGTVVSATIIVDKFSGRGKGFGFVEMSNDDEADKAIKTLAGATLNGRAIVVNEARPREERPMGGGNFNRGDSRGGYNSRR